MPYTVHACGRVTLFTLRWFLAQYWIYVAGLANAFDLLFCVIITKQVKIKTCGEFVIKFAMNAIFKLNYQLSLNYL